MEHYNEGFINAITKEPVARSDEDLKLIYSYLRRLDVFHNLNDAPLRVICCSARFEKHPANFILFRQGQLATCWYILLSGCVFLDKQIYLPCGCFGKRNGLDYRRKSDCVVLQLSEMIVIDYPDVKCVKVSQRYISSGPENIGRLHSSVWASYPASFRPSAPSSPPVADRVIVPVHSSSAESETSSSAFLLPPRFRKSAKTSIFGTTDLMTSSCGRRKHRSFRREKDDVLSSKYKSGYVSTYKSQVHLNGLGTTDTDTCVKVKHRTRKSNSVSGSNVGERYARLSSTASSSANEDDLHGLPEAVVDSEEDDESCPSFDSFHELRDSVRECLEKEPSERTADDICTLLDFMQHMSALATLPLSIKRQLCLKMVFAVVSEANTVVMQHNERIDAWSVIVNGQVEVVLPDGERVEYKLGDSFGVQPDLVPQYHVGVMRTLVDDCEFVLVEHRDYCSIMNTISEHIEQHSDGITGEIVSEIERRSVGNQMGQVLIKANRDKLIEHLIEERDAAVDAHYVEDFLLMYRVFINDPIMIFEKLMHWFADSHLRDKIARIVLLWVNNHFNDFECNGEMMQLLDRFEQALERDQMHSQQSLLNIACSVKSRTRVIIYSRSSREQPLSLSVLGGKENGSSGIFVFNVQRGSHAEKIGLKRGDQIIEVNGQSFKKISLIRALEILRGSTHLSITVKSNLLGFKEMIAQSERAVDVEDQYDMQRKESENRYLKLRAVSKQNEISQRGSVPCMARMNTVQGVSTFSCLPPGCVTGSAGNKSSVMDKLLTVLKGLPSTPPDGLVADSKLYPTRSNSLRASRSNPDIAGYSVGSTRFSNMNIAQYYQPSSSSCPEHVLKVYRADQSFKYLTVYRETTAQNVVQLALQEFGMGSDNGSLEWALCETTVTPEGVIKQKRLPDQMSNLAERIQLNSRYYLKNNSRSEPLVPDDLAPEVLKEAETHLLQLNAQILAAQLTLQDFAVFSAIEPTEYVDNLFNLESRYGWSKLTEFESLFNREMWWVATEVCCEKGLQKRTKLIKKFIKVARCCRDFRNFNSMFAIISGLEKPAVRRLHHTWERVPSKYMKMFEDVQHLVDPSRNMSKYRQHLAVVSQEPPVVPIYPVLKKDLTFSHEGNPTYCEKLINFEKLRMIAKAIRSVTKLCSVPYEISVMAQQSGGGDVSDALVNMNSFDGGAGPVATMRKLGSSTVKIAAQPRRKMYEQALMVRKVKSYLLNLKVVECEAELDQLSYDCEPSSYGSANVIRRRAPSPSPSSLSSQSSTSDQHRISAPKFGVESPYAVQKMLSLAQNSRVKQGNGMNLMPASPLQSPLLSSKGVRLRNTPISVRRVPSGSQQHSSGSRTSEIQPVDLNAESSSVTSLHAPRV